MTFNPFNQQNDEQKKNNPFGNLGQMNPMFGSNTQGSNIFGAQTTNPSNLQSMQGQTSQFFGSQQQPTSNIFGQINQPQQSSPFFGQTQAPQQNIFGGQGQHQPTSQPAFSTPQAPSSFFPSNIQSQSSPSPLQTTGINQTPNIFQNQMQPQQQKPGSVFGSQLPFGASSSAQPAQNVFGSNQQVQPTDTKFGSQQQQPFGTIGNNAGTSPFAQTSPQFQLTVAQPQQTFSSPFSSAASPQQNISPSSPFPQATNGIQNLPTQTIPQQQNVASPQLDQNQQNAVLAASPQVFPHQTQDNLQTTNKQQAEQKEMAVPEINKDSKTSFLGHSPVMDGSQRLSSFTQMTVYEIIQEQVKKLEDNVQDFNKKAKEIFIQDEKIMRALNNYKVLKTMLEKEEKKMAELEDSMDFFEKLMEDFSKKMPTSEDDELLSCIKEFERVSDNYYRSIESIKDEEDEIFSLVKENHNLAAIIDEKLNTLDKFA